MAKKLCDRFSDVITNEEELRAVLSYPPQRSVDKVVRVVDEHSRRIIAHAPFVFVASLEPVAWSMSRQRAIPQASASEAFCYD